MRFNLTSKRVIKGLLKEKNIHPSKRMGQNFLLQRTVLGKFIEAAELKPKDVVLEIGPGIGTLTREIAKKVKKVIAVEKDRRMIEILEETLKDFNNVEIIPGDILNPETISYIRRKFVFRSHYKVVSNLPYNIATEVIRKLLEVEKPPELMVVMIQKEVGERICSKPPKMERLGVLVQFRANVKIIETVKKDSFWPHPKVNSVILKIVPRKSALLSASFCFYFSKIVKAGFSHPRKQLINNLSEELHLPRKKVEKWLKANDIQPTRRAQTLDVKAWINLTKTFQSPNNSMTC